MLAEDFSVSVNAFFRDPAMPPGQYPSKDLYGNHNPVAADTAAAAVHAACKALQELPEYYQRFYGQRCLRALQQSCSEAELQ